MSSINLSRLLKKYSLGKQITMVTGWDALTARYIQNSKVDCLLVGDSLAMTALGYTSTVQVTLNDMVHHTKAVTRVATRPFVISDIPFTSMDQPLKAGIELMKNGCHSVKLEGVHKDISKMVAIGIPVTGHLGLNPQHVNKLGGYKVYRNKSKLIKDAKELESMGVWGIVLEAVPSDIAKEVQKSVNIPLIGIGAGVLDGQVLVFSDLLGLEDKVPKFCKVMSATGAAIAEGLDKYCEQVDSKEFPSKSHEYE